MEVKAGYKWTEIGLIPEDWNAVSIGEAFAFKNGLNKAKEYFGYGTPIVNYMDVFNNCGLKKSDIKGKVSLSKDEIRNYNVKKGDVFFTRTSETVEEVGMASVMMDDVDNTVFSGFILRGREKKEVFDLIFKKYCFRSFLVRKQITSKSSYTTRALTNGKLLSKILVPTPSDHTEQREIATALSDTDELISSLDKLITKKRNIKQAAMQQLLTGKKRLPGFSGEWEVKKLGEVAEVVGGGTPNTTINYYWNGDINWFTPTEIGMTKYINQSRRKISKKGFLSCSANMLPKGAILLTSRAGIGDVGILINESCTNQGFQSLIVRDGYYNEFLYYLTKILTNVFTKNASGSTFLEISPNKIRQIEVNIPKYEEQISIAKVLSDIDSEIEALEQKRDKYKAIKQGMMQQLLTGKTRLV